MLSWQKACALERDNAKISKPWCASAPFWRSDLIMFLKSDFGLYACQEEHKSRSILGFDLKVGVPAPELKSQRQRKTLSSEKRAHKELDNVKRGFAAKPPDKCFMQPRTPPSVLLNRLFLQVDLMSDVICPLSWCKVPWARQVAWETQRLTAAQLKPLFKGHGRIQNHLSRNAFWSPPS